MSPRSATRSSSIYTIGSSLHSWPAFEALLRASDLTMLIDVRSRPRSRLGHFNQASLQRHLSAAGMSYRFLGGELGGIPSGRPADYETMAQEALFLAGVELVIEAACSHRTVLMCSEGEPLECHRCLLLGRELASRGVRVVHILRDGREERHEATEDRLITLTRQDANLLENRGHRLSRAYRLQNQRVTGIRLLPEKDRFAKVRTQASKLSQRES